MEVSATTGTTALVYCLINSSFYTGTVQRWWSTPRGVALSTVRSLAMRDRQLSAYKKMCIFLKNKYFGKQWTFCSCCPETPNTFLFSKQAKKIKSTLEQGFLVLFFACIKPTIKYMYMHIFLRLVCFGFLEFFEIFEIFQSACQHLVDMKSHSPAPESTQSQTCGSSQHGVRLLINRFSAE